MLMQEFGVQYYLNFSKKKFCTTLLCLDLISCNFDLSRVSSDFTVRLEHADVNKLLYH